MTTYTGYDFWNTHPTPWPVVPLKRVARLGTGHTPSRSVDEYWRDCTIPWVTTEDLTARTGTGLEPLLATRQKISELGLANSAAELHPAGTVMLSRTASVGHVARIGSPMATTQAFVTWTCGPDLDPRYLTAVLLAMNSEFFRLAYGSTHLTIYMPDIEQIRVPVPPVNEQRAIADYLDTETARIDALITKKRRLITVINERRRAVRDRWYTEAVDVSGAVPLRRLTTKIEQGWSPVCDSSEAAPDEWGVLKTSAVTSGTFVARENKRLPEGVPPDLRWTVKDGDLLLARGSGSRRNVGAACVARTEGRRLTISDLVYRVRLREADPDFVAAALLSSAVREQIESSIRSDVGQTLKVRTEDLAVLRVPNLNPDEQHGAFLSLSRVMSALSVTVERLTHQIDLLSEHRRALITAAVTGELDLEVAV